MTLFILVIIIITLFRSLLPQGIVAAIRELGGRFLELNEREGIWHDIGDKKATEKTSQALREGQTKIRKDLFKAEENAATGFASGEAPQSYDTSLLSSTIGSTETVPTSNAKGKNDGMAEVVSQEGYFGYSCQVLEALYTSEQNLAVQIQEQQQLSPTTLPAQQQSLPEPMQSASYPQFNNTIGGGFPSHAMAMALDQFPGATMRPSPPLQQQMMPPLPQRQQRMGQPTDRRGEFASAKASDPSLRLTDMSMGSLFSIRQLLESSRDIANGSATARNESSSESILTPEIRSLIRKSEPQLSQIERMNIDELIPSQEEVVCFGEDIMQDRVSDLRFTDLSRDRFTDHRERATVPDENKSRSTEESVSTRNTSYSKTSLMDASIMSIPREDMSFSSNTEGSPTNEGGMLRGGVGEDCLSMLSLGGTDEDHARLLMRLSGDSVNHGNGEDGHCKS